METVTLTACNYRLQIEHDPDCEMPLGGMACGIFFATLSSWGNVRDFEQGQAKIERLIVEALENDRQARLKIVALDGVQEEMANSWHSSVFDAACSLFTDSTDLEELYSIALESAKAQGLIESYCISELSFDRSCGAMMVFACLEGYGEASLASNEFHLWASGDCYSVSLVCDMVDDRERVKYVEHLESICGIVANPSDMEEEAVRVARDYFDNPTEYNEDGSPNDEPTPFWEMEVEFA